ncbi:winged helix-turn-helix domain-containing protein [Pseudonocardia endophytica]|uniref:winged helix-turn-helix domain-containing protein n=1 Tax=Pseudonocardia endophytica TaxID=401976 RepID=UPI00104A086E|nr:winged helix-turn-helix domain-containing protein [Pseudonocardia endophytica]
MADSAPLHVVRDGRKVRIRLGAPIERADVTVASRIRRAISRGELVAGDKLPSENQMARALDVSRDPIRRGLQLLAADDLVEGRQGSGWFVREGVTTDSV